MLDTAPLLELLKSPSKQALDDFLCSCAEEREQAGAPTAERVAALAEIFDLSAPRARELQRAGVALVGEAMYAMPAPEQLVELFPDDFHADLRSLLLRVLTHRRDGWRKEALARGGVSSMPRLQGASWQAYRKSSEKGAAPAVLLSLQLEGGAAAGAGRGDERVHVELQAEQLDILLQGLGKVKDQLAQI